MAMTADSSQSHQSPRSVDAVTVNSPQKRKNLPSAWAQVVRGEPESMPALHQVPSPPPSTSPTPEQSTFSDCSPRKAASSPPLTAEISVAAVDSSEANNDNAGRPKKLAWKKPSNGVAEFSPVMGAFSWPALSESTKFSPKSPAADSSPKIVVSDGSMPGPQGHVIPHSPHKQASTNAKSNSTTNHAMHTRQRSMKRGGGGSGSGVGHSQSSFAQPPPPPPPPPPYPLSVMAPNGYGNMVSMPDQSPREPPYRGSNWESRPVGGFVPQPPAVNDSRHSSRRGNFGPRGDSPYHNNFGGRRDQDRGHYGNTRDVPVQSQRSPRGFLRAPPPNTATFVAPQSVRPFANPMGYPDLIYIPTLQLEPFSGMSYITPAPRAMIVPAPEPLLPAKLVHQIEYYFSDANLIKDEFLKSNMDDQGWVPITLIAGFNRVKSMTSDIQLILDSLRSSTVVEVQDKKVRRRNDWLKWVRSCSTLPADSGSQTSCASSHDTLTNSFQKMTVEATANENGMMVKSSPNLEDAPASSSEVTDGLQVSQEEVLKMHV